MSGFDQRIAMLYVDVSNDKFFLVKEMLLLNVITLVQLVLKFEPHMLVLTLSSSLCDFVF